MIQKDGYFLWSNKISNNTFALNTRSYPWMLAAFITRYNGTYLQNKQYIVITVKTENEMIGVLGLDSAL